MSLFKVHPSDNKYTKMNKLHVSKSSKSYRICSESKGSGKSGKSNKYELKQNTSLQTTNEVKSECDDLFVSENKFEVFKSLNHIVPNLEEKKKINKSVNTTNYFHEHNNYCATLILKCKECDQQTVHTFDM